MEVGFHIAELLGECCLGHGLSCRGLARAGTHQIKGGIA
jgi:hypothetical protein